MENINRPLALRILTFIAASTFLCYEMMLQVALAVVTEPLMASANINASHLGWLSACYFLSYTVMQIPAGLMFDKFSCRNVMFFSALFCALGAIIFAYFPSNILTIYLARFLIGAGSAFPFVGLLIVAANCFKEEHFPMFVGITQILAALGALLGSAPLALMVNKFGWLTAMKYTAFAGIICVLLMIFGLNILKKRQISKEKVNIFQNLKIIASNKQTWKIAAYAFFNWGPMIILSSMWGEPFLVEKLKITTTESAGIIQYLWIGLSIGSFFIGSITKSFKSQKTVMFVCSIIGSIASSILIYNTSIEHNYYFILSLLIGLASAGQILSFSMVKQINTNDIAGTAIGFNNMSVVAGGFILQPIIGELLQSFWNGSTVKGAPHYDIYAFKWSLAIIPLCYILSAFASLIIKSSKDAS